MIEGVFNNVKQKARVSEIEKIKSFYKLLIVASLVVGMLLIGYTIVSRDIQKISTSQLYDTAINMKKLQLRNMTGLVMNHLDSIINRYEETLLNDISFIKDSLKEAANIFEVEEKEQIIHHVQLLSQEYYCLEFTIWNQDNNQLEVAFLNGDKTEISKDLDTYLSEASLYETHNINATNQKIVFKVHDLSCFEEIRNRVLTQIDSINTNEMIFKFIKLEQAVNQNSNPNYFGYYVTNETDQTKYLYLDSTDLNGKYLLKEMQEALDETDEYFGISYHEGEFGKGNHLIYATTYDKIPWVLTVTLSLEELMDGTAQLIDEYEKTNQNRLKIAEGISMIMILLSFTCGAMLLEYHKSKEVTVEKRRNEMVSEHNKLMLFKQEQINQIAHDIKNHLISIKGLISADDSHPAIKYIDSVYEDLNHLSQTIITGHRLFDIILNDKISDMKNLNITFEKEIEKVSLDFIDDKDLTIILTNLLDNAIESCKDSEKKHIKLQLYTFNQSYLTLKITNSCDKPPVIKKGKLISQKFKKDIHGYGVKNIERSVSQYSGMSMWEYDEVTKEFKFTVMIPYV